MPDREKVIKAWECCNPFNRKCKECPYEKDCYHDGISRHMVADAIALLKEQEAVEPRKKNDGKPQPWTCWWYVCGDCGQEIEYHDRFCRWCGRSVKWE